MVTSVEREADERLLLARVARGDVAALELLYRQYNPRLRRFLTALGCSASDLDEACNETFFVVWNKASGFDRTCRLSTWIFGIARNRSIDLQRQERRRTSRRADVELDTIAEQGLNDAARLELQQWLEVALEKLPQDQRLVLEMAFVEGMSYQEIAQVLNCPENTIKTRMFHARRKLKHGFPEFINNRQKRNRA